MTMVHCKTCGSEFLQGAVKYRFCPNCRREYGSKLGAIQREYSHKMRMLCGNDTVDAMKDERLRRREPEQQAEDTAE